MNWLENILIIAGISLDIFASMEIQGAMLQKVRTKTLFKVASLVTLLQLVFFYGGYLAFFQIAKKKVFGNAQWAGYLIASIVFILLGIRLISKAIKREFVDERRTEITTRQYLRIICVTTVYTFFTGCACGQVGINVLIMLAVIIAASIVVTIGGIYCGYHFGFELKTYVYVIAALIEWTAGFEIIMRNVIVR